jgi:hypothetical protein
MVSVPPDYNCSDVSPTRFTDLRVDCDCEPAVLGAC